MKNLTNKYIQKIDGFVFIFKSMIKYIKAGEISTWLVGKKCTDNWRHMKWQPIPSYSVFAYAIKEKKVLGNLSDG